MMTIALNDLYYRERLDPLYQLYDNCKIKFNILKIFLKDFFMSLYPLAQNAEAEEFSIISKMANRHGLIAGATGTGKTVSLRVLAEAFSKDGVPIFLADVKGDLSGLVQEGGDKEKVRENVSKFNLGENYFEGFPVTFWDVFAEHGIALRTTISKMGPMLLARLLNLNDTQEGLLNLVFKVADDNGWLLLDLKDLRALLKHVADNAAKYRNEYGNVSAASVGAIQRSLLSLDNEGGEKLFGEPALDLEDWLQTKDGKGVINVLNAERLMRSPRLYSAFLLWMLSELFQTLPEVGDPDKPKFVMFFDEAHLLFDSAPKALIDQVEQVVRLIRSKGVGVYFVTQNPLDLPDTVLGQLGNRIQHALRAFTPRDQKAVKAAADTFRVNPKINVATAISELGVGEALVSFLDEKGMPIPVERVFIYPPQSRLEPLSGADRDAQVKQSDLYSHYQETVDNTSAFELLQEVNTQAAAEVESENSNQRSWLGGLLDGLLGKRKKQNAGIAHDMANDVGKTVSRQIKNQISKQIVRGLMGIITSSTKK